MNLIQYTPESFAPAPKQIKPSFVVTKGSVLKVNKMLSESLGIKSGDKLIICQDEKSPKDWFIGLSEKGFLLKPSGTDASLQFSCKPLAQILRDQFPKAKAPFRIPVAVEPTDISGQFLYALITRLLEK